MSLGENIYRGRISKNWSQTELAEALEVSRQSVSKWENDSAIPDLDKLIKMKQLFDVTLDELVFGASDSQKPTVEQRSEIGIGNAPNFRITVGLVMMVFGMFFLLLSIFWGDRLWFGEAVGELLSAVIVLISIALMVPYDFRVFSICTIIYFIYAVVSIGIIKVSNPADALFTFIASIVIVVWFIVCGMHATKEGQTK